MSLTFLIIVLAALGVIVVVLYNRLVRSRNRVSTAWSDIDVQLQRRHDLVPQLVKAVNACCEERLSSSSRNVAALILGKSQATTSQSASG